MLAVSVAAMVGAAVLGKRLAAKWEEWTAALTAAWSYLVIVIVIARILPSINEVSEAFPAMFLWRFRMVSFRMQLIMWATIALVFGALTEHARKRQFAAIMNWPRSRTA